MIDIKSRVHCEAAMAKVTTAEAAAALIKDGMNIALADLHHPAILKQFHLLWLKGQKQILSKSIFGLVLL